MVSVGVSKLGSTEIHFIEPSVKVNGVYYRINLLLAHRAHDTVAFLERKVLDFIPPTNLWPLNSTDLNSVDYL